MVSRRPTFSRFAMLASLATRAGFVAIFFVSALFFGGCASSPDRMWHWPDFAPSVSETTPRPEYNRAVFDHVGKLIDRYFYDAAFGGHDWTALREKYRADADAAVNDDDLYKTLNAMLDELGTSHIAALPPDLVQMQKKLRNSAVSLFGAVALKLPGLETPVVYEVAPGSPAEEAGIRRGWLQIGEMVREDSSVPIHEGETVQQLYRDEHDTLRTVLIKLRAVSILGTRTVSEMRTDGVLYLRFDKFDDDTALWLRAQLKTAQRMQAQQGAPTLRGVVLDLRLNGGGEVRACRRALGEFFTEKKEAGVFIDRSEKLVKVFAKVESGSAHYTGNLAVLVARMSGSGAEIFAEAIQHYKRGVIVGSTSTGRTAGAVLMSADFALPGGGELQVPVRDYATIDGLRLEGIGVRVDVDAPLPTVASLRAGTDAALELAAAMVRAESGNANLPGTAEKIGDIP